MYIFKYGVLHKCIGINNENICLNAGNLKTGTFSKLAVMGA